MQVKATMVLCVMLCSCLAACNRGDATNDSTTPTTTATSSTPGESGPARGPSPEAAGSCAEADGSLCVEYLGSAYSADTAGQYCSESDRTYTPDGRCPTTGVIGTCRMAPVGEAFAVMNFYYSQGAGSAGSCAAAGGVWTAISSQSQVDR
jgi:hypothetical protein